VGAFRGASIASPARRRQRRRCPRTRPKLIRALRTLQTKRVEQPKRKHGNIPL
jgi:hypothetical protein